MEAARGQHGPSSDVYHEEQYDLASSSSVVDEMPPGFRFHPADWEIIIYYLLNKVMDRLFRAVAIGEIDINKCEPWDLPQKAKMGENEWFFFSEKESKYPSGMRTNRATPSGYWKATGKDKEIYKEKKRLVGMKKTLVFYKGRAPKGEKTNWVIHEYRLQGEFPGYNLSADAKEKWVVCKVFHKKNEVKTSPNVELSRIDSFNVDRFLLDSPTTLPPLVDYSANSSCDGDEFKPTICPSRKINKSEELQQHGQNSMLFVNPNPVVFPYHHSPSQTSQHLDGLMNFPIQGADNDPNSRIVAPHISFNNSAIFPSHEINGCFSPSISDLDSLWSY